MMPYTPIATAVAALTLAATPAFGTQGPEATVRMTEENTFEPKRLAIEAGQAVEWTNPSSVVHTATADAEKASDPSNVALPEGAEPFDSGDVEPGGTYRRTFDVPGTYRYVCLPHEGMGMVGTIEVEASGGGDESGSASSSSGSSAEQSDGFAANLVTWLGKFHPSSVSFPIALIIAALVAELLASATGRPLFDHAGRFCVWFGAIGAVVAVTLGWRFAGLVLANGDAVMTTHRWLGTSAGVGARGSARPGRGEPKAVGAVAPAVVSGGLDDRGDRRGVQRPPRRPDGLRRGLLRLAGVERLTPADPDRPRLGRGIRGRHTSRSRVGPEVAGAVGGEADRAELLEALDAVLDRDHQAERRAVRRVQGIAVEVEGQQGLRVQALIRSRPT